MRFLFVLLVLISIVVAIATGVLQVMQSSEKLSRFFLNATILTTVLTHCLAFFHLMSRAHWLKELRDRNFISEQQWLLFRLARAHSLRLSTLAILLLIAALFWLKYVDLSSLALALPALLATSIGLTVTLMAYLREYRLMAQYESTLQRLINHYNS